MAAAEDEEELNGASAYIEWRCTVCGDNGMIHGWEDTLGNRRGGSAAPPETATPPTSH